MIASALAWSGCFSTARRSADAALLAAAARSSVSASFALAGSCSIVSAHGRESLAGVGAGHLASEALGCVEHGCVRGPVGDLCRGFGRNVGEGCVCFDVSVQRRQGPAPSTECPRRVTL